MLRSAPRGRQAENADGTPVAGNIENPAYADLFTFSAAAGAVLSIDIGPGTLS